MFTPLVVKSRGEHNAQSAAPNRSAAAARAAAVTVSPASILAISSRRSRLPSGSTVVAVRAPLAALETRKCAAPRAATCGLWVTTSTCTVSATRANRSPPTPPSHRRCRSRPHRIPALARSNRLTARLSPPASGETIRHPRRSSPTAQAPGQDWWRSGNAPDRCRRRPRRSPAYQ